MKKDVRKALERAKELEKIPVPTREEITAIYKDGLEQAEKLRKLLKPQWFIHDEKLNKKRASPTRKKKTL